MARVLREALTYVGHGEKYMIEFQLDQRALVAAPSHPLSYEAAALVGSGGRGSSNRVDVETCSLELLKGL